MLLKPSELSVDVPSSTPLTAASSDDRLQGQEARVYLVRPRLPAARTALLDPHADALVPTVFVAALAGRHLVLEPAWTALDPRHQMFRRRLGPPVVKRRATPNADLAVSGHRLVKSCTAPGLPNYTVLRRLLSSPH